MISSCYITCFEFTSLLWDLNEDRSNPYLNALKNKTPENVSEFLSKWNRGRGYDKQKLRKKIQTNEKRFTQVPGQSDHDLESYLKYANKVLKEVTNKQNEEYIGSVKLSHIYYPNIFPLIDNPILKEFELNKFSDFKAFLEQYFCFKKAIDKCIKKFNLYEIKVRERGIYKLVDEVLYLFITQEKAKIVEEILTITGNRLFVVLINSLLQEIYTNIKELLTNGCT